MIENYDNIFDGGVNRKKKRKQQKSEKKSCEWLNKYLTEVGVNYNLSRLQVLMTPVPSDYLLLLDDSVVYIEIKEKRCDVKNDRFPVEQRIEQYERMHDIKKQFSYVKAFLIIVWLDDDINSHDVYLADIDEFWEIYKRDGKKTFNREQFRETFRKFRLSKCSGVDYVYNFGGILEDGKKS